ncbi:MAG: protease SohB [Gammaproteobacteria bacterium]|nr:protease SohB [Gammaproteobacteria bacterium]
MEFITDYGLFLAKAVTIVVAIMLIIGMIASSSIKAKTGHSAGSITITNLTEQFDELNHDIRKEILSKEEFKAFVKQEKKKEKQAEKSKKSTEGSEKRVDNSSDEEILNAKKDTGNTQVDSNNEESGRLFVLNFDGDVQASAVENLREEISAILGIANSNDEILVRLESPGGMVHTYGLASSQLQRIKNKGLKLSIAVDAVAASGGYMMACVANRIYAAPFAIIGSIGVLGQLPNFHRLLKHNKVDFEQHTAGEFKRTLTVFGENTDKSREKFQQDLEQTHQLFKTFIEENRPTLDIEKVATGEHWYGRQAIELGLVDEIKTSDDIILEASEERQVFKVKYEIKKPLSERLPISVFANLQKAAVNLWYRAEHHKFYK